MKILVIYDSVYGNTKKVAEAIAGGFSSQEVKVASLSDVSLEDIKTIDVLIVGSPTNGGMPTPALQKFLKQIPDGALSNIGVAAFDTRFLEKEQNFALRLLMKTIGYAAPRIADVLQKKGGKIVAPLEGFIVDGKKGPLKEGELERATNWAQKIAL